MPDSGIVNIHGKEYKTVALRVKELHAMKQGLCIETSVTVNGNLVLAKATIRDSDGRVRSTGHAEEDRTKGQINKTSALENAETSAVGRALAFFGLGGTEIASADELVNALGQQGGSERPVGVRARAKGTAAKDDKAVAVAARKAFVKGIEQYDGSTVVAQQYVLDTIRSSTGVGSLTMDEVTANQWLAAAKKMESIVEAIEPEKGSDG